MKRSGGGRSNKNITYNSQLVVPCDVQFHMRHSVRLAFLRNLPPLCMVRPSAGNRWKAAQACPIYLHSIVEESKSRHSLQQAHRTFSTLEISPLANKKVTKPTSYQITTTVKMQSTSSETSNSMLLKSKSHQRLETSCSPRSMNLHLDHLTFSQRISLRVSRHRIKRGGR